MYAYVLDSSAILAVIYEEPGAAFVSSLLERCAVSSVNVCESMTRLLLDGVDLFSARKRIDKIVQATIPFDLSLALDAAKLSRTTSCFGLSLGDRACLATAMQRHATAITSDKAWAKLDIPSLKVKLIR
ncbi:MAG: type II toxin-antitoxin system VapC family toxin [Proteobacteria bacterium]|nr:type II toxin-antitoxin system VapC family toxin [Pseudomonadota bacterium]